MTMRDINTKHASNKIHTILISCMAGQKVTIVSLKILVAHAENKYFINTCRNVEVSRRAIYIGNMAVSWVDKPTVANAVSHPRLTQKVIKAGTEVRREYLSELLPAAIAMKTRQRAHVLSAFRPYLHALQAFNAESFRDKPISLKIRRVCCALFVSMVVVAAFVIFLGIWHMIENSLDLREFSTSIAIMLAFVQILSPQSASFARIN